MDSFKYHPRDYTETIFPSSYDLQSFPEETMKTKALQQYLLLCLSNVFFMKSNDGMLRMLKDVRSRKLESTADLMTQIFEDYGYDLTTFACIFGQYFD